MPSPFVELDVEGRNVRVSNPDKVYFPRRKETKLDLVQYYLSVGDGIVRALRDRPTYLKRHPDGVGTEAIYQKRVPEHRPEWIDTVRVTFPSGRHADALCVSEVAQVAWAANLATLDFHPWPARRPDVDHPDELRIDIDPQPGTGFKRAKQVAALVEEVLGGDRLRRLAEDIRATAASTSPAGSSRAGTSPSSAARRSHSPARSSGARPKLVTTAWWKEERGRRVFIDYNQNARDRTIASAYSVRARRDATVSAPVTWQELPDAETEDFTLATMPRRFEKLGDVQAAIDDSLCDLEVLLAWVERDESSGVGEAPYPPHFPKMPGEPRRVQPSKRRSE